MMYKRTSLNELQPFIQDYHQNFASWKLVKRDTLVRYDGPVMQGITFERLASGAYRPTGFILNLAKPGDLAGYELMQFLNIKHRQIGLRAHDRLKEDVLESIKREFVPNITAPLVAKEVLKLYEKKAIPTSPEAFSLAFFNAYMGNEKKAIQWSDKFTRIVNQLGRDWQKSDCKRRQHLDELLQWIKKGDVGIQLERVLWQERLRWNLIES